MGAKEPGQEFCETYAQAFADESETVAPCDVWKRLSDSQKSAWARIEQRMCPHLAEIASLRARVAELESEIVAPLHGLVELHRESSAKWEAHGKEMFKSAAGRGERIKELEAERVTLIAKLGEAIGLAGEMEGHADPQGAAKRLWALDAYHASLSQELPPDLPAPGRDRDAPRTSTVDRMEAEPRRDERLDRPEDRPGHVCEVGGCGKCDRAARERDERAKSTCTPCLTWQEPECGVRCRACGGSKEEHQGRAK